MPPLSGFGYRKKILWGTVFPGANLTDYPKLLKVAADSDIANKLALGGGIQITLDDETTPTPFGLYPSTALSSGDIIARAKFDILTAGVTGQEFGYLYFDPAHTTVEDKAGTVSNGFVFFGVPGDYGSGNILQDWVTGTLYAGSGTMSSSNVVVGLIDRALEFDGFDDQIFLTGFTALNGSGALTVEAVVEPDTDSGGGDNFLRDIFVQEFTGGTWASTTFILRQATSPDNWDFYVGGSSYYGAIGGTASIGVIKHLAGVYGASSVFLFENGNQVVSAGADSFTGTTTDCRIGGTDFGGTDRRFFSGLIHEVRVSSVARSADWLEYAYEDDSNNSDTFTLGPLERLISLTDTFFSDGSSFDAANIYVGESGSPWIGGLRFDISDDPILSGNTVTDADLTLRITYAGTGNIDVEIVAEAITNAPAAPTSAAEVATGLAGSTVSVGTVTIASTDSGTAKVIDLTAVLDELRDTVSGDITAIVLYLTAPLASGDYATLKQLNQGWPYTSLSYTQSAGGGITADVPVARINFSGIAPATAKTASVPAGLLELTAPAPTTAKLASVPVSRVALVGIEPATAKAAALSPVTIAISALAPESGITAELTPVVVDFTAPAIATSKAVSVPTALVELSAPAISTAKSAALTPGVVEFVGIAPATAKTASVPSGLIEFTGISPAVSRSASVPVVRVEFVSLAVVAGSIEPPTPISTDMIVLMYTFITAGGDDIVCQQDDGSLIVSRGFGPPDELTPVSTQTIGLYTYHDHDGQEVIRQEGSGALKVSKGAT